MCLIILLRGSFSGPSPWNQGGPGSVAPQRRWIVQSETTFNCVGPRILHRDSFK